MEINQYATSFCKKYQNSKQNTFYPIIQYLFNKLGLECVNSRYGVNPERWDSIIIDKKKIVPIEIKSPTEVLRINIKSIGQALENKIILHSRYLNHSDPNFTSLVVGYEHPNDRSEVSRLIIDIKKTY